MRWSACTFVLVCWCVFLWVGVYVCVILSFCVGGFSSKLENVSVVPSVCSIFLVFSSFFSFSICQLSNVVYFHSHFVRFNVFPFLFLFILFFYSSPVLLSLPSYYFCLSPLACSYSLMVFFSFTNNILFDCSLFFLAPFIWFRYVLVLFFYRFHLSHSLFTTWLSLSLTLSVLCERRCDCVCEWVCVCVCGWVGGWLGFFLCFS